jgi:hypothetical protein
MDILGDSPISALSEQTLEEVVKCDKPIVPIAIARTVSTLTVQRPSSRIME